MTDRSRLRLVVLGVLVISLVATLLGRLWYLQVLAAPQFRAEALLNNVKDVVTQAPRGEILDDEGRPLVENKPALVVSVDHLALQRQPDEGAAVLQRLGRVLHVSPQRLQNETTPCVYVTTHAVRHGKRVTLVNVKVNPCWSGSVYEPVPVSQLRPTLKATERALQIQELPEDYPGVSVALTAVRHYPKPDGALASAMLGYIGPIQSTTLSKLSPQQQEVQRNSQVGLTGLEASYEKYLHGRPGVKQVTVDHVGAVTGLVKDTVPHPGDDVVTNIDAKAQADLEKQLQEAITTARISHYTADYAAGVVLNVRTGGVVAMASSPTYPPSAFVPSISGKEYSKLKNEEGSPLFDKAFGSAAAPGSTFKPISSSGLIKDGTLSPGGYYECPQTFQNRQNFDGEAGLGAIPLRTALIVSCDTFFFSLGNTDWNRDQALIRKKDKPREGVQHMANAYGIGESPGIDLPSGEVATGHIADRRNTLLNWKASKKNSCEGAARRPKGSYLQVIDEQNCKYGYIFLPGDQMNEDVGQGTVLVSPLQLAVAYAAIANGGTVFEPRIVKAILSPSGKLIKRIKAPVRDHLPLPAADLTYIRDALYAVTTSTTPQGTATSTFAGFPMSKVLVGGKTGTAELSGTSQNGSWFASFGGPAGGKPQFVTVIEVNKSDQGAISSAPFVRNMWEDLYGFGGNKAVFPNGVPPTKLPKIRTRVPAQHHRGGSSTSGSTSGSTPGTTPGTPPASPTTTTALGLPPALGVRFGRLAAGTA